MKSMDTAPKNATWVLLKVKARKTGWPDFRLVVAHWASDRSGEEQPPFEGWFYDAGG